MLLITRVDICPIASIIMKMLLQLASRKSSVAACTKIKQQNNIFTGLKQ